MTDRWEDRAFESRDNIGRALDQLRFVEAIVFDGEDLERFQRSFQDLQSLHGKLERELPTSDG